MFRRIITRHVLGLIVSDTVAVFLAIWAASALYPYLKTGTPRLTAYLLINPWWQGAVLVQIYLFYLADLYRSEQESDHVLLAIRTATAVAVMTLFLVIIYFFNYRQSRGVILFYAPMAFVCVITFRLLVARIHPKHGPVRNIMMVCHGSVRGEDIAVVQAATDGAHQLRGIVVHGEGDDPIETSVPVKRIGGRGDLRTIVAQWDVDEIVLPSKGEQSPEIVRELVRLSYQGLFLSNPMTYYERVTDKLACEYLTDASFLLSHMGRPRALYSRLKRVFDVGLSALLLVLSSPICLVAAVLIKVTSRGPIFFTQERAGLDGTPFTLIKFRTMQENAEAEGGPQWAAEKDPRITKIGRILRKMRIDEFPQLLNVLKGDMSLIGPRPERPVFVEQFEREISYYKERLAVRPGITGWAQVQQGYAAGTEQTKEKLGYDLFYLKNQSFTLDLLIFFVTAKRMLRAGGK